jgi:CRISPR/Cas system CMR subunit Cmr4 (Cas7 group RAMP superfamily)
MELWNLLLNKFDPVTGTLIVITSLLLWRTVKRQIKLTLVNSCKIQAIFETIDKHARNGEGKYLRERISALLEESKITEE